MKMSLNMRIASAESDRVTCSLENGCGSESNAGECEGKGYSSACESYSQCHQLLARSPGAEKVPQPLWKISLHWTRGNFRVHLLGGSLLCASLPLFGVGSRVQITTTTVWSFLW